MRRAWVRWRGGRRETRVGWPGGRRGTRGAAPILHPRSTDGNKLVGVRCGIYLQTLAGTVDILEGAYSDGVPGFRGYNHSGGGGGGKTADPLPPGPKLQRCFKWKRSNFVLFPLFSLFLSYILQLQGGGVQHTSPNAPQFPQYASAPSTTHIYT